MTKLTRIGLFAHLSRLLVSFIFLVNAFFVSATMIPTTWSNRDMVGYQVTIPVQKGWNLIPPPNFYIDEPILPDSEVKKEDISYIWYYSTNMNKYYQVYPKLDISEAEQNDEQLVQTDYINYVMTSGTWVYSKKSGILKYNLYVSTYDYMNKRKIFSGWNFVVLTPEMIGKSLWEVRGSCTIEKVYAWGMERQNWDKVNEYSRINSEEAAGMSLLIKVSDNCVFGLYDSSDGGTTSPPGLPFDSNITLSDTSYKCTETDGGLNYYEKGAVYYGKYDYVDSCAQPGKAFVGGQEVEFKEGDLFEHSCYGPDTVDGKSDKRCTESACRYILYHCPNGCQDGACVR